MTWREEIIILKGKWVVAGEHSVIRGAPAIAMPNNNYSLSLEFFKQKGAPLKLGYEGYKEQDLLNNLLKTYLDLLQISAKDCPEGELLIKSNIPTSAGMGSSAALCVALIRWAKDPCKISDGEAFDLATKLEDFFHGNSSGMDIATVMSNQAIRFTKGEEPKVLNLTKLPKFTFHDTKERCNTKDCVAHVESLFESDKEKALKIDETSKSAVKLAESGLIAFNKGNDRKGLDELQRSFKLSWKVFEDWGLVTDKMHKLRDALIMDGALAVKANGSGKGGFLVALRH